MTPRLDNHQFELVEALAEQGVISCVQNQLDPTVLYNSIKSAIDKDVAPWEQPKVNVREIILSLLDHDKN